MARHTRLGKIAWRARGFTAGGKAIASNRPMSTERLAAAIRDSVAASRSLRISGRGMWLDAGRPVRADATLSLKDDSGVVSYVPGDLTLTVRAGTPLAEIADATRDRDQRLPLAPYGSTHGRIAANPES